MALNADKLIHLNLISRACCVSTLVGNLQLGTSLIRHADKVATTTLLEEELHLVAQLERKALHIEVTLLGIEVAERVDLI